MMKCPMWRKNLKTQGFTKNVLNYYGETVGFPESSIVLHFELFFLVGFCLLLAFTVKAFTSTLVVQYTILFCINPIIKHCCFWWSGDHPQYFSVLLCRILFVWYFRPTKLVSLLQYDASRHSIVSGSTN